jgi:hypothetical protein
MAKRIAWTEQAKADVCTIEQAVALQILKTMARYALTGEGNTKQLLFCVESRRGRRAATPSLARPGSSHLFSGKCRVRGDLSRA